MRVAIAGAGDVGQAIARALLASGHQVLLIERYRPNYRPRLVPEADWMFADACELAMLQAAGIETCDVVVAASGDDKVNLVFSMLCKTEFALPRVLARINHPANRWLFTQAWGIDVAVFTSDSVVSAAEEEVSSGSPVRLMALQHSNTHIIGITVAPGSVVEGRPVRELELPANTALLALVRDGIVMTTDAEIRLHSGDEIVVVASANAEESLR